MPIDINWLAGFFDGEGYIAITKSSSKKYKQYFLCTGVSQAEYEILVDIQKEYGGCLYEKKYKPSLQRLPAWELRWTCQAALDFIKLIHPYLKIKKPQAGIILQGWPQLILPKERRGPGRGLTSLEIDARQAIKDKLRALNSPQK